MRVLFSTYPTSFSVPGGGEYQINNTKKYLERLGVEVVLFDIWAPISSDSFDVLHIFSVCNSMEFYADWAIKNGVPYVVSPILWPAEKYSDDEGHRLRHILNNAKCILPNSFSEKTRIIEKLNVPERAQFHKIVNGIEPEKFANINRIESSVRKDLVLSIANVDRRKNHKLLAEACAKLGKNLVIAGRIRDVSYFEEIMCSFSENVKYIGPVANGSQAHISLLKQAEIFALPSMCETPGIAAIEAGAAGVPVLLTEVGAGPEYFGDNALYCDPMSLDSICEGLLALSSRSTILSPEQRSCFMSYTWELAASQTLHTYQSAVGQSISALNYSL